MPPALVPLAAVVQHDDEQTNDDSSHNPLVIHTLRLKRLPNTSYYQVVEADDLLSLGHIIDTSVTDKDDIVTPKIFRNVEDAKTYINASRPIRPLTNTFTIRPNPKLQGPVVVYEVANGTTDKTMAQMHQVQTMNRGEIERFELTVTLPPSFDTPVTFSTRDKQRFEVQPGVPLLHIESTEKYSTTHECMRCAWYLLCCPISVPVVMCRESADPFFDGDVKEITFTDHISLSVALSMAFFTLVPPRYSTRPLRWTECCVRSCITLFTCRGCCGMSRPGWRVGLRNDRELTWSEYCYALWCFGSDERPYDGGDGDDDKGVCAICIACMLI